MKVAPCLCVAIGNMPGLGSLQAKVRLVDFSAFYPGSKFLCGSTGKRPCYFSHSHSEDEVKHANQHRNRICHSESTPFNRGGASPPAQSDMCDEIDAPSAMEAS